MYKKIPQTFQCGISAAKLAVFPYVGMIQIRLRVGAFQPPLSPRISGLPFLFVSLLYAFVFQIATVFRGLLTIFAENGIIAQKQGSRKAERKRTLRPANLIWVMPT